MYNIYKYCFSLLIACCVVSILSAQENEISNDSIFKKKVVFNSLRLDLDVSPALTTFLNKGETYSFETGIQAEINKRFYPIIELGYGGGNKLTGSGIRYKGDALFYRAGMDFNLLKSKSENPVYNNLFLFGVRLGYTYFDYELQNISFADNFWGTNITKSLNGTSSNFWFEIAAGVRVELYKNLYIGWTVRIKNMLTKPDEGTFKPWYVPGYGIDGDTSVWGFNYVVGYKILNKK
jgi:hypothetical protein